VKLSEKALAEQEKNSGGLSQIVLDIVLLACVSHQIPRVSNCNKEP
jgi:hypothetical protein